MRTFGLIAVLLAAACAPAGDSKPAAGDGEPTYLFVQSAKSATIENGVLTLTGVSPSMLWFTDRPERQAGHCEVEKFIEAMTDNPDPDSFKKDPPNATLSVFDGDFVTDVLVTLLEPKLEGDTLSFPVKILEGPESVKGGPASLFIDPIGRPASPTSVAGVHRRERRRHVRHAAHRW